MAKRVVFYGEFNNPKKEYLEQIQIDFLEKNEGDRIYYLLPNGQLLKKHRNYFIDKMGGLLDLNIFTFDDIVDEILKGSNHIEIGNPVKNIIIRDILIELRDNNQLSYYGESVDMEGFIDSVSDIIGEIKRSIVSPEEYLRKMPNTDKYTEMGLIYKKYEESLTGNDFLDREGRYFESIRILKEEEFLEKLDTIIVDGFFDFRPIEIEMLKEFTKTDINIYINMPFKTNRINRPMEESFRQLESLGFIIEESKKSRESSKFEKIAENLFTVTEELIEVEADIIEILAPNKELEIMRVFQEIKEMKLIGYNLEDIGLVATSSDYQKEIFRLADRESIALNASYKEFLSEQVLARELINLLEMASSNGSKSDFINIIKSNYFQDLTLEDKEKYEYFLRREEFKDIYDFKRKIQTSENIKIEKEELPKIVDFIDVYIRNLEKIPKDAKMLDYNKIVIEILEEHEIFEKIANRYSLGFEDLFLRDIRSLTAIEDVLEEIESTFIKNDYISLEDYIYILEQYFEEVEILIREGDDRGVKLLSTVSSRNLDLDILFMLGLVQGRYPKLKNEGYFMGDDHIDSLVKIGLDSKPYSYRLDKEILNFVSGISSVRDKLYMSYYRGKAGENVESIFLEETKKQILNINDMESIEVDFKYGLKNKCENITRKEDLIRYLIKDIDEKGYIEKNLYDLNENYNPGLLELLKTKNLGEYQRLNGIQGKYTGVIEDSNLIGEIGTSLTSKYSISQLEIYANCPYMYFMTYILKIEEMERKYEDYSFMEMGSLYHEVLKDFYSIYADSLGEFIENSEDFPYEEAMINLKTLIKNNSLKSQISLEGPEGKLLFESIYSKLSNLLGEDIKRLYKHRQVPSDLEFKFGYEDDFIIKSAGSEVKMLGKIDRMDRSIDEDKYTVFDYKTGSTGIRSIRDMEEGLSLQLPVYIMSQKDNVVAAGYQIINNGKMDIKISKKEETNILGNRSAGSIETDRWEELLDGTRRHIVDLVAWIESGDYSVRPRSCPSYCIYSDICRLKKLAEVE